ncbi:MAG: hypothetical protein Q3M24_08200 [Candidatus Electrothrix aestuarii]|uniref:Uncharacterized protein n=1 Tax=Candidatus Electrothrix aestuarii TaxID=3062594 RepID=A0AAU8LYS0_9BACT|nr:hypothetical protein [Candidatus Electrothrix aestuarii]
MKRRKYSSKMKAKVSQERFEATLPYSRALLFPYDGAVNSVPEGQPGNSPVIYRGG